MNKHIIVRTDASVSPSKGVALGYEATVYHNDGTYDEHTGSHYYPNNIKTTRAEFMASIFATKEIYEEYQSEAKKYKLKIETDCEKTVNIYRDEVEENKLYRTMNNLESLFDSISIRWISRTNNTRADAIARSKLETGWNNHENSSE